MMLRYAVGCKAAVELGSRTRPCVKAVRVGTPPSRTCGCRESHPSSSGDELILVDEAAADVGTAEPCDVDVGDRQGGIGHGPWRSLVE
jgi:hypothetical protein